MRDIQGILSLFAVSGSPRGEFSAAIRSDLAADLPRVTFHARRTVLDGRVSRSCPLTLTIRVIRGGRGAYSSCSNPPRMLQKSVNLVLDRLFIWLPVQCGIDVMRHFTTHGSTTEKGIRMEISSLSTAFKANGTQLCLMTCEVNSHLQDTCFKPVP